MKNKLGVRKNHSIKAAPSQSAKDPTISGFKPEFEIPIPGPKFDPEKHHGACLCVVDRTETPPAILKQIPLSEYEFFSALLLNAGESNGLETFIADAVREKLKLRTAQICALALVGAHEEVKDAAQLGLNEKIDFASVLIEAFDRGTKSLKARPTKEAAACIG